MTPTLPLPFGAGLDRDTGIAVVQPATARDLRNVEPARGRLGTRLGSVLAATLPDQGGSPCTSVRLIHPLQSQQEGIVVGYYAASRELHVYRVSGLGVEPAHVGLWFELHADAVTPPHLSAADNFGLVVLAHDEPLVSRRGPTVRYSAFSDTPLETLEADFDGAGSAPIRFRGVRQWMDYMVGWGFGAATQDHPEYVRVSLPGQPLVFDPDHYFIAGNRGVPVTGCAPAGGSLVAFKLSEAFNIVGQSHLNFGILPLYALTGCVSARLMISIDGVCFFRSAEGFRFTTGAETGELGTVLDLRGPGPDDLPAEADLLAGFCHYLPDPPRIEWVFGERIYLLTLDEQEGPKWSYRTRPVAASAGGLLYAGGSPLLGDPDLSDAPTGHVEIAEADGFTTTAEIEATLHDVDGNETIEPWIRIDGGSWEQMPDVPVGSSPQTFTLEGLEHSESYDVTVRLRRGGLYGTGYTSSDPGDWPAASRDAFTTHLDAPTVASVVWARESFSVERARVTVTPAATADDTVRYEFLLDGDVVELAALGVLEHDIKTADGIVNETIHAFTAKAAIGADRSDASAAVNRHMGPVPPSGATREDVGAGSPTTTWHVKWTNETEGAHTEILADGDVVGGLIDPGTTEAFIEADENAGITVRHVLFSHGTSDRSLQASTTLIT